MAGTWLLHDAVGLLLRKLSHSPCILFTCIVDDCTCLLSGFFHRRKSATAAASTSRFTASDVSNMSSGQGDSSQARDDGEKKPEVGGGTGSDPLLSAANQQSTVAGSSGQQPGASLGNLSLLGAAGKYM